MMVERLGIGVVTYNRKSFVTNTVERIVNHTKRPYELVIADDGSTDGTPEALHAKGHRVIFGRNMGVCWNKNRILFFLHEMMACDTVILIEDDTFPIQDGWEDAWIEASTRYGHIGLAGDWFKSNFISGSGGANDPYVSTVTSGQCEGFSREALSFVGYLDTRFKGYGVGHVEHTMRFLRAGYGGEVYYKNGKECYLFYLISAALKVEDPGGNKNPEQVARNQCILHKLRAEAKLHRSAWSTDEEMIQFRGEVNKHI